MQKYENLVDLEKMLQNEYLVAIVAVDTAENEPSKNLQNLYRSARVESDLRCQERLVLDLGRSAPGAEAHVNLAHRHVSPHRPWAPTLPVLGRLYTSDFEKSN